MKTYHNNEEVKQDIHNGVLAIDDDIEIAFDGFNIDADIRCKNIYSKDGLRNIVAWNINAYDINADHINARNINARNINAWNINAYDINAYDINADYINARNINSYDINADYISYYAVCLAYKDIKCKSINGRRKNSRHFCLDGKIIIKEEIEK